MFDFLSLRSLSIAKKLGLLTFSAIAGVVVLTALFLASERKLIMEERQSGVRQVVESVHGLLAHYHALAANGTLSEEQAKQQALQAIRGLRYSGSEYFWINDMQPRMVMHPISPALDNKDLSGNKDATGKQLFVEFVNTVKASEAGFVAYLWAKPGSDKPVPKVSYVKGFKPWGWIIGSGVYVDTVHTTILHRLIGFSICASVLAAILLAIGWAISRGLLRQLGGEPAQTAGITLRIAQGDLTVPIELKKDDSASLLHSIKGMRDSLAQGGGRSACGYRHHRHGLGPDLRRQPESFFAHRGAGQLAGADGRFDGRTHQHRQAERGQRAPGESARAVGLRSGGEGRRRGQPGGRHHGFHQCLVEEDRRHHRRHRRHRVPDQHPGVERSGGSGTRRRAGPRLRSGGRRSAQPRAALGRGGQGDQGPDRRLGGQGRRRQRAWWAKPARRWKRSWAA